MKRILDRSFRYTPSFQTDVRETFERIRREREEQERRPSTPAQRSDAKVLQIDSRKAEAK
jgi:hypothetical protein